MVDGQSEGAGRRNSGALQRDVEKEPGLPFYCFLIKNQK